MTSQKLCCRGCTSRCFDTLLRRIPKLDGCTQELEQLDLAHVAHCGGVGRAPRRPSRPLCKDGPRGSGLPIAMEKEEDHRGENDMKRGILIFHASIGSRDVNAPASTSTSQEWLRVGFFGGRAWECKPRNCLTCCREHQNAKGCEAMLISCIQLCLQDP